MRSEIRHIEPIRFANVVALVYGFFGLVIVVLTVPFLFLSVAIPGSDGMLSAGITLVLVLLYPIFGLVIGWVTGLVAAAIYNLVVRWVGGITIELRTETAI